MWFRLLVAFFVCSIFSGFAQGDSERPNVVIIYADDLGYGDVRCYNPHRGKIPTPHIDGLAEQGMRFTDGHSSSGVCSPSRYTLLTGRYHWRSRLQRGIVNLWGKPLINSDRTTIGSLARKSGYRTACIGKWHLGWNWSITKENRKLFRSTGYSGKKELDATDEHREAWKMVFSRPIPGGPLDVGFDEYFGTDVPNWPPYCFIENDRTLGIPSEYARPELFKKNQASQQGPSLPEWSLENVLPAIKDRAVEFIHREAKNEEPFLLYLSLTSPHTPLAVNDSWKGKSHLNLYADLVMETDDVVGQVLAAIENSGVSENTFVLFTSDNGCAPYIGVEELETKGHFPSAQLRGYKADAWEGGHRVPFIAKWPGITNPGTTCNQLVHQADLLATLADIFGTTLADNEGEDSFSMLPLLQGEDKPIRDYAVSCSSRGVPALRQGPWKYIAAPGSGGWGKGGDQSQPVQLYDLENDIQEKQNLAAKSPKRLSQMKSSLERLIANGRSTPGAAQKNDVKVVRFPKPPNTRSQEPASTVTASQKSLPLAGEVFKLNGEDAFIILPENANHEIPWVWYAPTLPGLPGEAERWMFERFLKHGIAIAGIDVGESYGSPNGTSSYDDFYNYLVKKRKFSSKPCLLARSRGGLMLYSWAAANPESVSGIAGIYPVCNLTSYPGIARACGAYGLTAEQLQSELLRHNPIDRLSPLAKASVPIFHLHGDNDKVVPLKNNSGIVAERYRELGGDMRLKVFEGQGHNMWPGWFQNEDLVNFVVTRVTAKGQLHLPTSDQELWLTYSGGDGPGKGKHVVLIAADQEYRSEQSMPMLAKILSQHHGFDCTVLFSVNEKGEVDPTLEAPFKDKSRRHNIPGLKKLADADCVIWLSRFMQLPEDQLRYIHEYFDSGKPLISLRTANHGLWGGPPYLKDGKRISLREMLGGSFMSHHGGWHRESTKGLIVQTNKSHPILIGVKEIWGPSDVYRCHNEKSPFPEDCVSLVLGQPLVNLQPDAPPNSKKEPLPIAWTKTWVGNQGRSSRLFHFTMGSAKDFENEGVRRITINAVYWGLGMEQSISANRTVEPIGEYRPLKSGFNYDKLGVRPRPVSFYR